MPLGLESAIGILYLVMIPVFGEISLIPPYSVNHRSLSVPEIMSIEATLGVGIS